ncbi:MAG: trigger factor family protein, partial [Chloroflexi bacterium]
MTITVERLPNARVSLEIAVDSETVERHMERAVTRVSRQVRIPGFRPGHVPRKMLERHVGTAALLQEALQELLPEVYSQAIEEQQVDAIDQPEFDL